MSKNVEVGSLYRHYKGGLYYVEKIVFNTETEEEMVVYHAIDNKEKGYARPVEVFLQNIPKYNKNRINQNRRFEKINLPETLK